jgi:hypothetical protein
MDSFNETIFYPITYILSPFSINHISSCLGSRVDMVSNLDLVYMIFALSLSLFNNYLATSAKRLDSSTINVHRNYGDFCNGSALSSLLKNDFNRVGI